MYPPSDESETNLSFVIVVYPTYGPKVSEFAKDYQTPTHCLLLVSLVFLISCIACSQLILSLRGLYYSRMVVSSTASGTMINGEYARSTRVSVPCASSSGAPTTLSTLTLATRGREEDDWVYVRSGVANIDLENLTQERRDSTRPLGLTTERIPTV